MRRTPITLLAAALLSLSLAVPVAAVDAPASATDLLPGVDLVTEEVEPGVFRVVSDGMRELSRPVELGNFSGWGPPGELYRRNASEGNDIVANQDGVWLRRPEDIIRLGENEPVWAPDDGDTTPAFTVAPDGTLYQPGSQLVLEGDAWEKMKLGVRKLGLREIDRIKFAPDDSLWVLGNNGKQGRERRQRLARRDADGWSRITLPPVSPKWLAKERERLRKPGRAKRQPPRIDDWAVTPDGTLYVTRGRDLQRFDGAGWETLERPGKDNLELHVGPDGAVWVSSRPPGGEWDDRQVARIDTEDGATVDIEWQPAFGRSRAAGADGAFWYASLGDPMTTGGCAGITRVDGPTTTKSLEGLCIYDIAIGPHGGVWLEAGSWDGNYFIPDAIGPVETYVITPEAVAATE